MKYRQWRFRKVAPRLWRADCGALRLEVIKETGRWQASVVAVEFEGDECMQIGFSEAESKRAAMKEAVAIADRIAADIVWGNR